MAGVMYSSRPKEGTIPILRELFELASMSIGIMRGGPDDDSFLNLSSANQFVDLCPEEPRDLAADCVEEDVIGCSKDHN